MTELEKRVLGLIPIGASQPQRGGDIALALKMDGRTVKRIINRLIIRYGIPIVAKRGAVSGYYIPATDGERLDGIRELKAQHDNEGKRLNVLINATPDDYQKYLKGEAGDV